VFSIADLSHIDCALSCHSHVDRLRVHHAKMSDGPDLSSIREMKKWLAERKVSTADLIDKESLVKRVRATLAAGAGAAAATGAGTKKLSESMDAQASATLEPESKSGGATAGAKPSHLAADYPSLTWPPFAPEAKFEPLTCKQFCKRYPLKWKDAPRMTEHADFKRVLRLSTRDFL
jgi:hypothetical protein